MFRSLRGASVVHVAGFWTVLLAVAAAGSSALANATPPFLPPLPPPNRSPAPVLPSGVPLVFSHDASTSTSRLVIPKKFLEQAGWQKAAGGPSGDLDVAESSSPLRTVIAGVLLSAAAVSLVLMRKAGRTVKIVGVLVVIAIGSLAAFEILGPRQARAAQPPQAVNKIRSVEIEIVDEGDAVRFVHGTGK